MLACNFETRCLRCSLDISAIKGQQDTGTIKYDYLVYAVGAETQTFNIKGVREYSCFMKELKDAEKVCVVSCVSWDLGRHNLLLCPISFVPQSWIVSLYKSFPMLLRHSQTSKGIESAALSAEDPKGAADVDRLLHLGELVAISSWSAFF